MFTVKCIKNGGAYIWGAEALSYEVDQQAQCITYWPPHSEAISVYAEPPPHDEGLARFERIVIENSSGKTVENLACKNYVASISDHRL